jgi:hypothetical protein
LVSVEGWHRVFNRSLMVVADTLHWLSTACSCVSFTRTTFGVVYGLFSI